MQAGAAQSLQTRSLVIPLLNRIKVSAPAPRYPAAQSRPIFLVVNQHVHMCSLQPHSYRVTAHLLSAIREA